MYWNYLTEQFTICEVHDPSIKIIRINSTRSIKYWIEVSSIIEIIKEYKII